MEVVVEEATNHEDVSPFVDLEAYRGQDDRQAKSLRTPVLLQASHYILQGLSILFACVGSGDPVRVLRLYTLNTLDILRSIYC